MQRRKLIVSFSILLSVSLLLILKGRTVVSAAGHTTHTYGTWSTYTKANCTSPEVQKRSCTYTFPGGNKCGASQKREVGSALGHSMGSWYTSKNATCTSSGTKRQDCGRSGCSYYKTENIAALGHSFGSYSTTTKATCTTAGKKTATCTRQYCYAKDTKTIPATGHSYTGVIKRVEATCTTDGWEGIQCNNCGDVSSKNTIPAKGHDWVDQYYVSNPTCTTDGGMLQNCSVCGEKRTVTEKAPGHSFTGVIKRVEATCTTDGWEGVQCNNCGEVPSKKTIPAKGHDWEDQYYETKPTCTTDGGMLQKCSVCGEKKTDARKATGHSYTGVIKRVDATCTTDGWEGVQCNNCGEVPSKNTITAKGHDWEDQYYVTKPTCTTDGGMLQKCSVCGEKRTDARKATGHSYTGVIRRVEATCTTDGWEGVQCNNCGEVPSKNIIKKLGHDWQTESEIKKVTCLEDGAKLQVCSRCNNKRTTTIKAFGHSYTGVVKTKEPTCIKAGYTGVVCNNCGEYSSKIVLDPLGHNFELDDSGELQPCTRCGEKPPKRSKFNVYANTEYHFHAKGVYDANAANADRFEDMDKQDWGMITINSSEDFTVSVNADWLKINVNGKNYKKTYSGKGKKNDYTYVYIQADARKMSQYGDRECTLTITSGNNKVSTKITQSEYLINSSYVTRKTEFAEYIDARFSNYISSSKWQSGGSSTYDGESDAEKLKRRLHGDVTTNGVEIFQCTNKNYSDVFIAVNSEFDASDKDYINVTYSVFHVFSTDVLNATQTRLRFDVIDSYGMIIDGNTFYEKISSNTGLETEEFDIAVKDPEYEKLSKIVSAAKWAINKAAGAAGKYFGGSVGKFVASKVIGLVIKPIGNSILKSADSRQSKSCIAFDKGFELTIDDGTELSNPYGKDDEQSRIDVLFISTSPIDYNIRFSLKDTYGNTGAYSYSFSAAATGNVKTGSSCNHTFYGSFETVVEPTCEKSGLKVAKCTKCGEKLYEIEAKALDHDLVVVDEKKATCGDPGYKKYECSRENCDYTRKDVIRASHVFNGDYFTTKEPTCTEDGLKEGKCHICRQTVSKIVLPALGHEAKDPKAKNPVCKRCGLAIEELDEKLSIWEWQDNMTYDFRWNGYADNATNPWTMIELNSSDKPCIRFSVTAQNDWTVTVSGANADISKVNLSMNGKKSQSSLSGTAGTSSVYVYFDQMPLASTTDNSATLTFKCGKKKMSCRLYQSSYKSVNGVEMSAYINDVKASGYYKYFKNSEKYSNTSKLSYDNSKVTHKHNGKKVSAEDHLFGKVTTDGIEFFHCTDPAYGNVFMAVDTYIDTDGNVYVKYCVFRISYENVMNAVQKNIQIKVLNDNGIYLRNSNGKMVTVRGNNLDVENINVKSVDKDFEAFQEALDVTEQFMSTIEDFATISSIELNSLTEVIFKGSFAQKAATKCKSFAKLLGKMGLKKVFDDSNVFTLTGVNEIQLAIDEDGLLETGKGAINLLVAKCSTGYFDFSLEAYDYYRGTSASICGSFSLDKAQC